MTTKPEHKEADHEAETGESLETMPQGYVALTDPAALERLASSKSSALRAARSFNQERPDDPIRLFLTSNGRRVLGARPDQFELLEAATQLATKQRLKIEVAIRQCLQLQSDPLLDQPLPTPVLEATGKAPPQNRPEVIEVGNPSVDSAEADAEPVEPTEAVAPAAELDAISADMSTDTSADMTVIPLFEALPTKPPTTQKPSNSKPNTQTTEMLAKKGSDGQRQRLQQLEARLKHFEQRIQQLEAQTNRLGAELSRARNDDDRFSATLAAMVNDLRHRVGVIDTNLRAIHASLSETITALNAVNRAVRQRSAELRRWLTTASERIGIGRPKL